MISKADPGFKRLSVVGLGYVGLPTAAIFAGRGLDVLGVDINVEIVELINQGKVHLVEPELDKMVLDAVGAEFAKRPQPRAPYRYLGMLPAVGAVASYFGECGALARAAKQGRRWITERFPQAVPGG